RILAQHRNHAEPERHPEFLQDLADLRLADLVVRLVVEVDLVDGAAGGDDEQLFHAAYGTRPALLPRAKRARKPGRLADSTTASASATSASANQRAGGRDQATITPCETQAGASNPAQNPASTGER